MGGDLRLAGALRHESEDSGAGWRASARRFESVEERLLDFFHHSPKAFRETFILYMVGQVTAVAEVYLILRLMGCHAGSRPPSPLKGLQSWSMSLALINPGNAGTYEGGNMLFARLAM